MTIAAYEAEQGPAETRRRFLFALLFQPRFPQAVENCRKAALLGNFPPNTRCLSFSEVYLAAGQMALSG